MMPSDKEMPRPHLESSFVQFWSPHLQKEREEMQKVQRRAKMGPLPISRPLQEAAAFPQTELKAP